MNTQSILKVVVVVGHLALASTSYATEGTWTRKADMPTPRVGPYTAVVDGKIYAIGGGPDITGGYLSTVEKYDPTTDTWTRKANMPTARNGHAIAMLDGKIYVIGGEPRAQASLATVEEYDPATDTWTQKADMPSRRTFLSASTVDGKIYAFGGCLAGVPEVTGADRYLPALEVYDPATDTWTRGADMMTPRAGAAAVTVDGKIYVIGGVFGNLHNAPLSIVEAYDPITDTWTRKANIPTARMFLSASVVGGRIYAIGGGVWGGAIYSTVEVYDPATDTWTSESDMPTARNTHASCAVSGKIYAIGGTREWFPGPGISTVEEYDLTPQPPDFNGDGIVDIKDLLKLIESWDQSDPITDIAPPPFGDGIVDALDLELLMSYWEQPVDDPTLLAHWALDETEGIIAYDSAGVNDAVVVGGTAWQPNSGQIDGALMLDGVDGYALKSPILNPANGPFSVFAWIKGGAPGQIILSQLNSANWLGADSSFGCLMTGLIPPATGRFVPQPLESESVITDDQWHRVGFVWNGVNRSLYVDDILVAEDMQQELSCSDGGLNIGCGSNSAVGTYWSGLIDEVRIYSRAVSP